VTLVRQLTDLATLRLGSEQPGQSSEPQISTEVLACINSLSKTVSANQLILLLLSFRFLEPRHPSPMGNGHKWHISFCHSTHVHPMQIDPTLTGLTKPKYNHMILPDGATSTRHRALLSAQPRDWLACSHASSAPSTCSSVPSKMNLHKSTDT
jgi:hypothetical protein